jgi:D-glycero-alpha-D-manno-heptose-7-phosphate kinase
LARPDPPEAVIARAPCRIDCGGTLDIDPLSLGLMPDSPATFNIALRLRTEVSVRRTGDRTRRVRSAGFESLSLEPGQEADYTSPLGFFLLAIDYFGLEGVELTITSSSPPRSALGGSSAAILASVAALARMAGRRISRLEAVHLAHLIESALFATSCGRQDHLAAAYGGVRLWTWTPGLGRGHRGRKLLKGAAYPRLEERLLIAYPGQTHSSAEVNSTWVRGFLAGPTRETWRGIAALTRALAEAVEKGDWRRAGRLLLEETALRAELTPEVLTESGRALLAEAERCGAGARFTGAGGGGCLFALGSLESIRRLKESWAGVLEGLPGGRLLSSGIDRNGLRVVTGRPKPRP